MRIFRLRFERRPLTTLVTFSCDISDKMLSSFGRLQLFLLCLPVLQYVSSADVNSFDDFFQQKAGNNESMTDFYNVNVNESVTFWLYTKAHPDNSRRLVPNDPKSLESSGFDCGKPTKILIHGWLGNSEGEDSMCMTFKKEYFALYDYNVVCVDWSTFTSDCSYIIARLRCKEIGNYIGEMIETITGNSPQCIDNIHIIGFSIGAHIAGFTGKRFDGKLSRITGLDPARPLFFYNQLAERLNPTDAQFVDVVHTSSLVLGQHKPLGTIDFYPNGGNSNQPGCGYEYFYGELCSHFKSCEFYARSIRSKDEFKSTKCDDWEDYEQSKCEDSEDNMYMGEFANFGPSGNYYLSVK